MCVLRGSKPIVAVIYTGLPNSWSWSYQTDSFAPGISYPPKSGTGSSTSVYVYAWSKTIVMFSDAGAHGIDCTVEHPSA